MTVRLKRMKTNGMGRQIQAFVLQKIIDFISD